MKLRFSLLLLAALTLPHLYADPPGVYAIQGGTVHTVTGGTLQDATVVIRNGLIESVGRANPPADAAIVDAKGKHVYPGLIDAQTSIGLAPPARSRDSGPGAPSTPAPRAPELDASAVALRGLQISDDDLSARRNLGVTTVVTAPAHAIFNGTSVILNLSDAPMGQRVVRPAFAQQIAFNTRPTWTFPDSLMGVITHIRQTLLDATNYAEARQIYERNPAGLQRPASSAVLDALVPVIRKEMPVVFVADSEAMMLRAATIAREFGLRYVLSGAREAYRIAPALKAAGAPVLVSVKWIAPPAKKEDREEQSLRTIRNRVLAPTTPAVLARESVPFALVSGAGKSSDFIPGIRKAIANGLTSEQALHALTIAPARILGIDRQLGSLERGKIANVVISDGPPFEEKSRVTLLFVDGRQIQPSADSAKGPETSPVDGTWSVTIKLPSGDTSISLDLRLEAGRLTGTYSGDTGSGEIRNGRLEGDAIEFTITASADAETNDWLFRGTLKDKTMEGTVTTQLGTFPFSGSKSE